MKKDVIYIDTEDDITSIIDKVKHADAPIVALVPPKRVGVLQSTVNLKLLQRSADSVKKRIVLITNDNALMVLASTLSLPIAKNLQSKPEIAPLSALAIDDDDVIDGNDLPVGELAGIDTVAEPDLNTGDNPKKAAATAAALPAIDNPTPAGPPKKAKPKVPDFDTFRKKLFLFGGLGVLLIVFLVWALLFAGKATIAITARTNLVNINKTLTLKPDAQRDINQGVLPVITKQIKKTASIDFQPTGKKDVGEKATGTVKLSNSSPSDRTIAAGTTLTTSGDLNFITNTAVTVDGASLTWCGSTPCASPGVAEVAVTAAERGSKYNGASGTLSGAPTGVSATFTGPSSGGTDKVITVVSAEDVAKASEQLKSQDANVVKDELSKQFADDEIVIREAYTTEAGTATPVPAVDQEASAAKLVQETTYTLLGIKRADLKAIYDEFLRAHLKGDVSQRVYKSGDEDTQFSGFQKIEGGYTVQAVGAAQIGPNIDDNKIAEDSRSKRVGEVQQDIEAIQGVESVDVKLSPFWVNRVPNDVKRIDVNFVIKND